MSDKELLLSGVIRDTIKYDPDTGILLYGDGRIAKRMTSVRNRSWTRYIALSIKRKEILGHRAAWFLYYGKWPIKIDHIDGNGLNNKIENLRSVDDRGNNTNMKCHRDGKLVGITWHKKAKKWQAEVKIGNKKRYLGLFKTPEEANHRYIQELIGAGIKPYSEL